MVKQPEHVAVPVSGLVTITFSDPTDVVLATLTKTSRVVALTNVVETTVMPVTPTLAVAPLWNPVPVTTRSTLEAPWPRAEGDTEVTLTGADGVTGVDGADGVPLPIKLMAVTVNVYESPFVRSLTVQVVDPDVHVCPPFAGVVTSFAVTV
jgi:hypothetical protein